MAIMTFGVCRLGPLPAREGGHKPHLRSVWCAEILSETPRWIGVRWRANTSTCARPESAAHEVTALSRGEMCAGVGAIICGCGHRRGTGVDRLQAESTSASWAETVACAAAARRYAIDRVPPISAVCRCSPCTNVRRSAWSWPGRTRARASSSWWSPRTGEPAGDHSLIPRHFARTGLGSKARSRTPGGCACNGSPNRNSPLRPPGSALDRPVM
jgi:hypothetical protein